MNVLIIFLVTLISTNIFAEESASVGENLAPVCKNSPQGSREPKVVVEEKSDKKDAPAPAVIAK